MRLGIDASGIRSGGGVAHLAGILGHVEPTHHDFEEVVLWCDDSLPKRLRRVPSWLTVSVQPWLSRSYMSRLYWQQAVLPNLSHRSSVDLVLCLAGIASRQLRTPLVAMSQNLLPFNVDESRRYGWTGMRLRLWLLRQLQLDTFHRAKGLIFLSEYARRLVLGFSQVLAEKTARVIPHGVADAFRRAPDPSRFVSGRRTRLLYVSIIDMYKHQWNVAKAASNLINRGYDIQLDFIGPAYPPALRRLKSSLASIGRNGYRIRYLGEVPSCDLTDYYHAADIFVFASSCETIGIVLLEAMAAGLPIAASNRGPMPEILGDAGVYFDPERPQSIAGALRMLLDSPELRQQKAWAAFGRAQGYSWERCSMETFSFLAEVARTSPATWDSWCRPVGDHCSR